MARHRPLALAVALLAALAGLAAWLATRGDVAGTSLARAVELGDEEDDVARAPHAAVLERAADERASREIATTLAAADDASEPADAIAALAEPAPGVVTGRVVLAPERAPVAGAEVLAGHFGEILGSALSDAEGRFRIALDQDTLVGWVEVEATPTTTGTKEWHERLCPAGRETDVGEIEIESGATLQGRVVDRSGVPVPDARVFGWCRAWVRDEPPDRHARSRADGTFTIEHLGTRFRLTAETDTLACAAGLEGELVSGTRVDGLEIVLAPGARFSGRVLDEAGRPISGADVQSEGQANGDPTRVAGVSSFQPYPRSVETAEDGTFQLAPVEALPVDVRVSHPDHLTAQATLEPDVPAEIRLARGDALRGLVLADDGTPVEGASVSARGHQLDDRGRGKTGADGRFELHALTRTTTRGTVWVHASGHAICVRQGVPIGPDAPDLVLQLEPASTLAGVVLDAEGLPVAGARVAIEGDRLLEFEDVGYGEPTTWEWRCGKHKGWSDADGRFRFEDLYDGAFALTASHPDSSEQKVRGRARSGDLDVVLRFGELARDEVVFEGRVVDALSGAPVVRFGVTPMTVQPDGSGFGNPHDVDDEHGGFRIGGYAAGRFGLHVNAPGYARWDAPSRDYEAGVHRFDVALAPSRIIDVVALDADDKPLPTGTRLSFRTRDGRALQLDMGDRSTMSHLTLRDGRGRAAGLPADRLVAVLDLPDDDRQHEVEIDLLAEPSGPVELRIDASPSVLRPR